MYEFNFSKLANHQIRIVICKCRNSMVIHNTECPYWDQVSLNNTNPTQPSTACWLQHILNYSCIYSVTTPWAAAERSKLILSKSQCDISVLLVWSALMMTLDHHYHTLHDAFNSPCIMIKAEPNWLSIKKTFCVGIYDSLKNQLNWYIYNVRLLSTRYIICTLQYHRYAVSIPLKLPDIWDHEPWVSVKIVVFSRKDI